MKTAYFVKYPRRIEDLRRPHRIEQQRPFMIETDIELRQIDYENFITDLCVDRRFIEDNMSRCLVDKDGVWHCIFVHRHGRSDGVLVMSEGCDYPKWAAYYSEE